MRMKNRLFLTAWQMVRNVKARTEPVLRRDYNLLSIFTNLKSNRKNSESFIETMFFSIWKEMPSNSNACRKLFFHPFTWTL